MKNILLILNVFLLLAVGVLFYFHFSSKSSKEPEVLNISQVSQAGIYYVNSDSLWKNYELVKKSTQDLGLERMRLENEFKGNYEKLEQEARNFQAGIQKGIYTEQTAGLKQQEILAGEQELMQKKDKMSNKLIEMEYEMDKKIRTEINHYLKDKAKELNVQYILAYSMTAGGAMLYGNDSLDITAQVVDGLNKIYQDSVVKIEVPKK